MPKAGSGDIYVCLLLYKLKICQEMWCGGILKISESSQLSNVKIKFNFLLFVQFMLKKQNGWLILQHSVDSHHQAIVQNAKSLEPLAQVTFNRYNILIGHVSRFHSKCMVHAMYLWWIIQKLFVGFF